MFISFPDRIYHRMAIVTEITNNVAFFAYAGEWIETMVLTKPISFEEKRFRKRTIFHI